MGEYFMKLKSCTLTFGTFYITVIALEKPPQTACPTGPHMGLAWAGLG